ncbi:CPBP family intramembrane glutamic endopeptidase [Roseateles terrae]|uniref:CAAX prenyl protease 2/Lysostaphin resistance protein A-like domain-containing protein n=1 Tax=Roseateles terrae TaxID=431060 RepID=A0ABR6GMW9_9BURK|nr:CPBP family intramembrane glutamic endopeptidase [Roseateles terrae]MBB3193032.1 hypothetical protein [Roseateles terrae]OWQ89727.1 hypothetical protein CDN98_04210 [Roseateles terrae]
MPAPFVLLLLSIVAVWLPSVPVNRARGWRVAPWLVLYAAAIGLALLQGVVSVTGAAALAMLVLLADTLGRQTRPALQGLVFAALLLLVGALCLHAVPGFRNPIAIDAVRFSEDARPFTQYLNFDKGSVGLVLLALLAPRLRREDAVARTLGSTLLLTVAVAGLALGLAVALGMIRWDPKWPPQTLQFLVTNLLLTCVAEEALFRVMVQDKLATGARSVMPQRIHTIVPTGLGIVVSALLFGAVHAGGGLGMIVVAAVAGLGYAVAYHWQRRIEVAVLVHFGVNALHFVLFTYPLKA